MIHFKENFQLKSFNTFGIDAYAKYFVEITCETDIHELIQTQTFKQNNRTILGGGSNILFTKDFEGLMIHPLIADLDVIDETNDYVKIKAGCGIIWDDFVSYAVNNGWGGIENLSDIPGNIGACPIQNIGAYGSEVESVIEKVIGYDLDENRIIEFTHDQCEFGYRTSIFKTKLKNRILITHVLFRLNKVPHHLNISYSALVKELENSESKTIQKIREIVMKIRGSKLPQVSKIGSAGSFFKNPIVEEKVVQKIVSEFPSAPVFPAENSKKKLSAAWLIDQSGCKGLQVGDAATYSLQPLVLVNNGNATGAEVLNLSRLIQKRVEDKFGISLEPEVNIL